MNFVAPPSLPFADLNKMSTLKIQQENSKFFHFVFFAFLILQVSHSILIDFYRSDTSLAVKIVKAVVRVTLNIAIAILFHIHTQIDYKKNTKRMTRFEVSLLFVATIYYIPSDYLWLKDLENLNDPSENLLVYNSLYLGLDVMWRFFIFYAVARNGWIVAIFITLILALHTTMAFVHHGWLIGGRIVLQTLIIIGVIVHAEKIKMKFFIENRTLKFQDKVNKSMLDSVPESLLVLNSFGRLKYINKYMKNMFGIRNEPEFKSAVHNFTNLKFRDYIEDEMIKSLSSRLNSAKGMTMILPPVVQTIILKDTMRCSAEHMGNVDLGDLEKIHNAGDLLTYLKNNVHKWKRTANFALVFDTKYQHKSGNCSSIELKVYVFHEEGETNFILIMRDTTDRDRIANLESANAIYRNNVIASFSHELRTPLNSNLGVLQHCMESSDITNHVKKTLIEPALISAKLLLNLVSDILDYSQFLNAKLELKIEKESLQKTIEACTGLFEDRLKQKGVKLEVSLKGLSGPFYTDHGRFAQVLLNLLSNAYKFTTAGKVTIDVKQEYADIYRISVIDTGIGMDEDAQIKLRKNMDSGELKEKVSSNSVGVGIGLFISNILAFFFSPEKNQSLKFESKKGHGTTFYFLLENKKPKRHSILLPSSERERENIMFSTLPSIFSDDEDDDRAAAVLKTYFRPSDRRNIVTSLCSEYNQIMLTSQPTSHRPRVLIVDDEVFNILIVETFCKSLGVLTERAFNGKEAIEKIIDRNNDLGIKLVLTDVNMPIMDGYETTITLNRLMANGQIPEMKIVGITAYISKEKIDKCYECGMDDVLNKPLDKGKLTKVFERYGIL